MNPNEFQLLRCTPVCPKLGSQAWLKKFRVRLASIKPKPVEKSRHNGYSLIYSVDVNTVKVVESLTPENDQDDDNWGVFGLVNLTTGKYTEICKLRYENISLNKHYSLVSNRSEVITFDDKGTKQSTKLTKPISIDPDIKLDYPYCYANPDNECLYKFRVDSQSGCKAAVKIAKQVFYTAMIESPGICVYAIITDENDIHLYVNDDKIQEFEREAEELNQLVHVGEYIVAVFDRYIGQDEDNVENETISLINIKSRSIVHTRDFDIKDSQDKRIDVVHPVVSSKMAMVVYLDFSSTMRFELIHNETLVPIGSLEYYKTKKIRLQDMCVAAKGGNRVIVTTTSADCMEKFSIIL